jgi:hypothetical protein
MIYANYEFVDKLKEYEKTQRRKIKTFYLLFKNVVVMIISVIVFSPNFFTFFQKN